MLIFVWACVGFVLCAWWISGSIYAAIIVAIPLGLLSQIGTGPVARWVYPFCFLTPWVPLLARLAWRRLSADVRVIAGTDVAFAEPLSLEINSRR